MQNVLESRLGSSQFTLLARRGHQTETGKSCARHGHYYYKHYDPVTCGDKKFAATNQREPTIGKDPSDGGRRVAIIDVPKAPLLEGLNSIQKFGWATEDLHGGLKLAPLDESDRGVDLRHAHNRILTKSREPRHKHCLENSNSYRMRGSSTARLRSFAMALLSGALCVARARAGCPPAPAAAFPPPRRSGSSGTER